MTCLWWVFMFVLQLLVLFRLVAILSQWLILLSIHNLIFLLHPSLVNDEFLIRQKYCICKLTGICHFSRTKIQIFLSQRIWYVNLIFNSCCIYTMQEKWKSVKSSYTITKKFAINISFLPHFRTVRYMI